MHDRLASDPKGDAILLAAGLGRRLGAGMEKGFVSISGRPLLAWSLETFAAHPLVRSIVVVHSPTQKARDRCLQEVIEPLGLVSRVILVSGGERRQDSSLHGIQALPVETLDHADSLVMVHDAARPLVSSFLITHTLRELGNHPDAAGALPALPIRETLKRVGDSWIVSTVDREGLWGAQTPQVFRLGRLLEAHKRAAKEGWAVTDDAGLLEAAGERLRIIPGDLDNIKVTYPEDRLFVERLLHQREGR